MEFIGRSLAFYLAQRLGLPIWYEETIPWQERERRFDAGTIQMAWICGLPYVQKVADPARAISLLAAPVPAGARYGGRPVYFSDIVVRRDSPFRRFEDLRGATWSYNEPNSHSGYTTIRYALARRGEDGHFFGRVIASGAHEQSLALILAGDVDGSAIDSTVLEMAIGQRPELADEIRVLDTIGPSPSPPLLANDSLPAAQREAIQDILWNMHKEAEGRRLLEAARLARFAAVKDATYDTLRKMTAEAAKVHFAGSSSALRARGALTGKIRPIAALLGRSWALIWSETGISGRSGRQISTDSIVNCCSKFDSVIVQAGLSRAR